MDYQRIYDSLILRSKSRKKPDCYCERHHILPRSMGGKDESENIAILTAREHFIAHWLLKKIHNNKQCIYAFHAMTKPVGNGRTRYSSHSFKYARESMAKYMSENRSGCLHPLYGIDKKDNPNFGSKRSEETKRKLSMLAKLRGGDGHPNAKRIMCVETGEIFGSISSAKKKHKTGNISYALRTGGKAGGMRFVYEGEKHVDHLPGYANGKRHALSIRVFDDLGNEYDSASDAAKSIGVTRSAIYYSLKKGSKCKGRVFRRG